MWNDFGPKSSIASLMKVPARLEELPHDVRRVVEESGIGVRSRDGHGIRPDLPSAVRADDPVGVEERELRVARDRIQVAAPGGREGWTGLPGFPPAGEGRRVP